MADEDDDWMGQGKKLAKRAKEKGSFTLETGDTTIRILPNAKGTKKSPFKARLVHYNVGPNKRRATCGKDADSGDGDCWLCDTIIPKLEASGKKSQIKLAKTMESVERVVVQVAYMREEDEGKLRGPKFWTISARKLWGALLTLLTRGKVRYDDPVKGKNLTINRVGTDLKTQYGSFEPDEEPSQVPKHILAKLKPFSDTMPDYDEDDQKKFYRGEDASPEDEDDEDVESDDSEVIESDDEDEKPKKKKKKPVDDDEELDAEEEDEKPKKKKSKSDEDDEDEKPVKKKKRVVEDEDDEDEKPKKKKKSKSDEDDEDEAPSDEEEADEDAKPKKKKKPPVEEEDDEDEKPAKKKKKPVDDEDEDEAPKKKVKKKRPVVEDDEDEDTTDDDDEVDDDDD